MSNGDSQPPSGPFSPTGDSDNDGVNNATEQSIDSSARYQARIALVTAVVALVSALLGPLVSLKINSDQIDVQTKNNKAQIAAQHDATSDQNKADQQQSESEFIRTERRQAYGDFLAAFNNGAVDLTESGGKITVPGYPPKLLSKELEGTIATLRTVTSAYSTVTLVVSPQAQDEAQSTYSLFAQAATNLLNLGSRLTSDNPPSNAQLAQFQQGLGDVYAALVESAQKFNAAARDDLQASSS